MRFTFYKQLNAMDCGPTCLRMIAMYYGKHYNTDTLRNIAGFSKEGVSLLGISDTAEKIGFRTRAVKLTIDQLREVTLPCVLHRNQNHFVALVSVRKRRGGGQFRIADPAKGMLSYNKSEFSNQWLSSEQEKRQMGIALLLEASPSFYKEEEENRLSV